MPTAVEETKEQKVARLSAELMGADAKATTVVPEIDVDKPQRETSSRSTKKGFIKWGMMTAPFKIYSGTSAEGLHFNNCCPTCSGAVNAVTTCKSCNTTFDGDDKNKLKKGYKVAGNFVFVDKSELEACEPTSSDVIEVIRFVKLAEIDPIYLESTSLMNADKGGEKVLTLLRTAMLESDTVALVKICERGRENSAILRPYTQVDGTVGIAVSYLFFDHEIRNVNFTAPAKLSAEEVSFAKQLADAMTDAFNPTSLDDSYAKNVRKLIASKVAGVAAPVVAKAGKVSATSDLMGALKQSLAAAAAKAGK